MPEKQFACNLSDVAQDKPFKAFVNDRDYGIYQIGDEYFALRNKCPASRRVDLRGSDDRHSRTG